MVARDGAMEGWFKPFTRRQSSSLIVLPCGQEVPASYNSPAFLLRSGIL